MIAIHYRRFANDPIYFKVSKCPQSSKFVEHGFLDSNQRGSSSSRTQTAKGTLCRAYRGADACSNADFAQCRKCVRIDTDGKAESSRRSERKGYCEVHSENTIVHGELSAQLHAADLRAANEEQEDRSSHLRHDCSSFGTISEETGIHLRKTPGTNARVPRSLSIGLPSGKQLSEAGQTDSLPHTRRDEEYTEPRCEWGNARLKDVVAATAAGLIKVLSSFFPSEDSTFVERSAETHRQRKAEEVRRNQGRHFPLPVFCIIPSSLGHPRILHKSNRYGEVVILLSARDKYWAKYIYQVSHEVCHFFCRGWIEREPPESSPKQSLPMIKPSSLKSCSPSADSVPVVFYGQHGSSALHEQQDVFVRRGVETPCFLTADAGNNWFEEVICEVASLTTLRQLAEEWTQGKAPFENWRNYGKALRKYAENCTNRSLDDFFAENIHGNWRNSSTSQHISREKANGNAGVVNQVHRHEKSLVKHGQTQSSQPEADPIHHPAKSWSTSPRDAQSGCIPPFFRRADGQPVSFPLFNSFVSLKDFYRENETALAASDGQDRSRIGIVAQFLLPYFEYEKSAWKAIQCMNQAACRNISLDEPPESVAGLDIKDEFRSVWSYASYRETGKHLGSLGGELKRTFPRPGSTGNSLTTTQNGKEGARLIGRAELLQEGEGPLDHLPSNSCIRPKEEAAVGRESGHKLSFKTPPVVEDTRSIVEVALLDGGPSPIRISFHSYLRNWTLETPIEYRKYVVDIASLFGVSLSE